MPKIIIKYMKLKCVKVYCDFLLLNLQYFSVQVIWTFGNGKTLFRENIWNLNWLTSSIYRQKKGDRSQRPVLPVVKG